MAMTPEKFEKYVQGILKRENCKLKDFKVTHLEKVAGMDGEYIMDVVCTFSILGGATLTVLIECKRHTNSIKREMVQILNQKLQSTGAHKGMIFSTSEFQDGAIEFAKAHGIALVHVEFGKKRVFVTNYGDEIPPPTPEEKLLDSFTSILVSATDGHQYPYLGRSDVYPGQNLLSNLKLIESNSALELEQE